MKLTKKKYLQGFAAVVILLAIVRWAIPEVAVPKDDKPAVRSEQMENAMQEETTIAKEEPSIVEEKPSFVEEKPSIVEEKEEKPGIAKEKSYRSLRRDGSKPHRILSVPSYKEAFPDTNAVQLVAARRWGVSPVKNREDAEARKKELVYVASSPFYHVDKLHQSIPYLVPRAAILLQDIGQAFFDSLYVKGVPLHRFIVTSVLRTQEDVARLRNFNGNATENSCHLYGTTFDICYNRYETVEEPDGPKRYQVRNDTLKFVLSEVLRDMRKQNRCYIKYEVKQGCFHMTVR